MLQKRRKRENNASWNKTNQNTTPRRAKAQASTATSEKMKYGKAYRIATINIRGAKRQGAREEVEAWMKKKYRHSTHTGNKDRNQCKRSKKRIHMVLFGREPTHQGICSRSSNSNEK